MKKKLVLVLIFGYVGGSFSGEPLSPFGENPFAPHTEAHSNPFQIPSPASAPSPSPTLPLNSPEHSMPLGNPFAAPAVHENPFNESHAEHREEPTESVVPHNLGGEPAVVTSHFGAEHTPSQFAGQEQSTEGASEKNQDTGEEAAIDSEVDTFEQEGSGNWLLKRVWWEKTEAVYEQIKQVFNEIMNARMDYISQRNRLDRELDIAYGEIGLEEGELQDIIEYCLDFTKKEKTEQGFLTKQEEELHTALEHKKHDLEQIKLDLKALQAVDQKIDEALDTLFKQIDVANQYEQKAWDNFKEIARELNDKIARKSYYETEGLLKDIQNVHSYIVNQFSSYFNQTLQSARTHSQNITSQVQTLKQAGVDLKKQAAALEQAQEAERVKKEVAEQEKARENVEKKKEVKKNAQAAQKGGKISQLMHAVKEYVLHIADRVLEAGASLATRVKNWFVKEDSVVKAREKTLKVKKEEKVKSIEESPFEKEEKSFKKEVEQEESVIHSSIHEEEQKIEGEAEDLKKSALHEEAQVVKSVTAEAKHIESELERPFEHEKKTVSHPVSVMPQGASHQTSHTSVTKFGLPPTEEAINHPAFSYTSAQQPESPQQKGSPSLSPFAN